MEVEMQVEYKDGMYGKVEEQEDLKSVKVFSYNSEAHKTANRRYSQNDSKSKKTLAEKATSMIDPKKLPVRLQPLTSCESGDELSAAIEPGKVRCEECAWRGIWDKVDIVKDPGSDGSWFVCPDCRSPEKFESICDEIGCKDKVCCGTPTEGGYRHTCSVHKPK